MTLIVHIIFLFSCDGEILLSTINPEYAMSNNKKVKQFPLYMTPGGTKNSNSKNALSILTASKFLKKTTGLENIALEDYGTEVLKYITYKYWKSFCSIDTSKLTVEYDDGFHVEKTGPWKFFSPKLIEFNALRKGLQLKWSAVLKDERWYSSELEKIPLSTEADTLDFNNSNMSST